MLPFDKLLLRFIINCFTMTEGSSPFSHIYLTTLGMRDGNPNVMKYYEQQCSERWIQPLSRCIRLFHARVGCEIIATSMSIVVQVFIAFYWEECDTICVTDEDVIKVTAQTCRWNQGCSITIRCVLIQLTDLYGLMANTKWFDYCTNVICTDKWTLKAPQVWADGSVWPWHIVSEGI